uniref:Probable intron-encoded DNA endonuclease 2 n=2 Tax=Mycosarcoma maydis TaxID=5270 RepID=IEND2_MYCMD|nr:LAGLIDADG endonuclease [Ustilago maydis]Q0H8Z2.1 RecName: Full=Probable intron-encoded DNA endonuclease 2 [Ustilago maydis 521]AAZ67021.1 LAGLIDADG endonuclease [Ustilago maydis]ACL27277.1 putative LAGLIDADG endonuclease [Ustilago maydis]ACL27280.1 putative LAGLIDADG endonuclease [Ustilago maydis]ACL27283.1 putative LAGLIDADG endonuclease [Ustilago maydis]ACL27290.1 putative LAGLIDADG endonuclease [Ustilago maydis]
MVLNDKVYENISPQTLACWFMDDGGMNGSHSHGLQFRVSVILK